MTEQERLQKNARIKENGKQTRKRHASMICRVFTVKIQQNKLNKEQKACLEGQFREAKWIYNDILSRSENGCNVFALKDKDFDVVNHLDKDGNKIQSELKYLPKRTLQMVISGVKSNIVNLSKLKQKGVSVGKLNFISEYNSINLAQYGNSYRIVDEHHIKINGIKKHVRVLGLEQFIHIENVEIANAKLLNRPDGYYIAITVYCPKTKTTNEIKPLIGIDYGCQTSFTLSDGRKYNYTVEETERLKRLQAAKERCKKGSNNRRKMCLQIRREYQKMMYKKNDMANKFCHEMSKYRVVMQDEQLAEWQENSHGGKISHSILGRVKSKLLSFDDTYVLSQWIPTTKFCTECGESIEITQRERTFTCPNCGHKEDRDVHAAKNMLWFFYNKELLCPERDEYKPEVFKNGLEAIFGNREAAKSLA